MSDFTLSLIAFFICITVIVVWIGYVYWKKNTHTKGYFAFAVLTATVTLTVLVMVALWTSQTPWAAAIGLAKQLLGLPTGNEERLSHFQIIVTLVLWAGTLLLFWKMFESWQPEVSTPSTSKPSSMPLSVQVGKHGTTTWLPQEKRLGQIHHGQNPYVQGTALQANSPVFVGRESAVDKVCAALRRPEAPASVSVLGERRMGKSSLLNQVVVNLAADQKTLVLALCAQEWQVDSIDTLFEQWHRAFAKALGVRVQESGYAAFPDFLQQQAKRGYRFVVVLDEFEALMELEFVNATLLGYLRSLAEKAKNGLGFVLSSRRSIHELCLTKQAESSSFWNIFNVTVRVGLLETADVECLIGDVWRCSGGEDLSLEAKIRLTHLAGRQGFLLQCVLSQLRDGAVNWQQLEHDEVQKHYVDWWMRRSSPERRLLKQLAAGEQVADSFVLQELQLRGLVEQDQQLFSKGFAEFVRAL